MDIRNVKKSYGDEILLASVFSNVRMGVPLVCPSVP